MSGVKAAQVRMKLQNVIKTTQKTLKLAEENNERLRSLSNMDISSAEYEASTLFSELERSGLSATALEYCADDVHFLEEQKQQIAELMAEGEKERQQADQLRRDAEALHIQAVKIMGEAVETGNAIAKVLEYKIWYLDREDATAAKVRSQAKDAIKMERESANLLREALDHARRAKNAFDSVLALGKQNRQRTKQVEETAVLRETTVRIAEENQRRAVSAESEVNDLLTAVKSLNHEKFCPGEFRSFSNNISIFQKRMNNKDYAAAARAGDTLCPQLRQFYQKISSRQTAFETAQIAARNSLESAMAEINQLDRDELLRWTEEKEPLSKAFLRVSSTEEMIRQEEFAEAEKNIAQGLMFIRNAAQKAEENKVSSQQRFDLAEVIMNALYGQGYDAPAYYYKQQNNDGSDVEFSDLTVFAKSPGKNGDMRLNIDLAGNVKIEVEGIEDGEEAVCHQLIQDLQKGVGDEIDFHMTDWGRAAHVDQDAKVKFKTQEKNQEKTRERQNG